MSTENKEEKMVREYFEHFEYSSKKLDLDKSRKMPDYLFEKGELRFVVEVKNIEEQNEFVTSNRIVEKVRKILEDMNLHIGLSFEISEDIREQDIRKRDIRNAVRNQLSNSNVGVGHGFEIPGKIRFKVFLVSKDNSKCGHFGIHGLGKLVDGSDRIREDIKDAVAKYKNYGKELAYILILFPKRFIFDDDELITGIFGDITFHISTINHEVIGHSRRNSSLQSKKNTSISAVALYKDNHFEVYHNPYKAIELPYEVFNRDENIQYYVDDKTGEIREK